MTTDRPVRFPSHGIELAGDIVTPEGEGPWPAAVLLHGASWGERRFNRVFAEAFADAGIASLLFDRRGEGASGGVKDMDLDVLAADAVAAHAFLARQEEIDPDQRGLWGFSNGAWVATIAASRLPACAFLLLTGASGVSPAEQEVYRRTEDLRRQGIAAETLAAVERWWSLYFAYLVDGRWQPEWDRELPTLRARIGADAQLAAVAVPEFVRMNPQLASVPDLEALTEGRREPMAGAAPSMGFDPIPALERVACPVLILLGEHDANVPVARSVARFAALAANRAPGKFSIEVLPGADHAFSRDSYRAEGTRAGGLPRPMTRDDLLPAYLDRMTNWLADATRRI